MNFKKKRLNKIKDNKKSLPKETKKICLNGNEIHLLKRSIDYIIIFSNT